MEVGTLGSLKAKEITINTVMCAPLYGVVINDATDSQSHYLQFPHEACSEHLTISHTKTAINLTEQVSTKCIIKIQTLQFWSRSVQMSLGHILKGLNKILTVLDGSRF